MMGPKPRSLLKRMEEKYIPEPTTGCWLWMAAVDRKGYGVVSRGGRGGGRVFAHRAMYEAHRGAVPDGKCLDHLCRTPSCINPWHLEATTWRQNILRGDSHVAAQARQTHCKHGHEFTPDNTYWEGERRRRGCKECRRRVHARYAARRRQRGRRQRGR